MPKLNIQISKRNGQYIVYISIDIDLVFTTHYLKLRRGRTYIRLIS